jgi:hypothetical protein
MSENRDTAPDGSPRTERDAGLESQVRGTPEVPPSARVTPEVTPPVRVTPDVEFDSEEATDLNVALQGATHLPPESIQERVAPRVSDEEPADRGSHTPVVVERQAIVGLDRTHRSQDGESGSAATRQGRGPSAGSTTGGHTQRSLSEIERPTSSLRALDGRFQAIEQKLDQLDARLRLLEKRGDKNASAPRASWLFWVVVLVALALVQLLLRRT